MRFALVLTILVATPVVAQRPDPETLIAAQREAMKPLAAMDGMWRGPARTMTAKGWHELTQTERVGPFLGGAVRLIEGRGHEADGRITFNAFAVLAYNPITKAYSLQSNAMGFSGVFPLTLRSDGWSWQIPAGPGAIIRYTATIKDGTWHEVGERVAADGTAVKTFEMTLRRIGATDWPGAGAVPPK